MSLRPKTLRVRLTVWYVFILAGLVILAWGGSGLLLYKQLLDQLDHFNVEAIDGVEELLYFAPDGTLRLRDEYPNHPESKDWIDSLLEVRSSEGALLFRNDRLGDRVVDGPVFRGEGVGGYFERSGHLSDGTRVRLVSRVHILNGHPLLIRLAHSERTMTEGLSDFLTGSLILLPFVLGAAGVAGYFMTRRALNPINEMVRRARQISPDRLSERLPVRDVDDELDWMARIFNDTLDRLERAFEQLRRFTADCSHELRTPLAMIRGLAEAALQKKASSHEESRDTIASILEEINRLTSLVEALFTMSRADSGTLQLRRSVVPIMALAREAAGLFDVLMEEKSLDLVFEGDELAEVEGDRLFLRQAFVNLIHNAVKYSPLGGAVSVRVRNGNSDQVRVEIQDHGPGIPPEDRIKVFERFYRVDKARSRESGGAGLGLSIAKWAVEAHGGSIGLESVTGQGCTFYISLPRLHS